MTGERALALGRPLSRSIVVQVVDTVNCTIATKCEEACAIGINCRTRAQGQIEDVRESDDIKDGSSIAS